MRSLLWVVPIAFFFLNPGVGCGSNEPEFQFGAAEMRAAIEGEWSFTITSSEGAMVQVTVNVEQASAPNGSTSQRRGHAFVRAAYACGTRTLVKSAEACIESSEMPLAITYVSGDDAFSAATMSGTFSVLGLSFARGGYLELMIGAYQIISEVNPDGSLVDPHLGPGGQGGTLTVAHS